MNRNSRFNYVNIVVCLALIAGTFPTVTQATCISTNVQLFQASLKTLDTDIPHIPGQSPRLGKSGNIATVIRSEDPALEPNYSYSLDLSAEEGIQLDVPQIYKRNTNFAPKSVMFNDYTLMVQKLRGDQFTDADLKEKFPKVISFAPVENTATVNVLEKYTGNAIIRRGGTVDSRAWQNSVIFENWINGQDLLGNKITFLDVSPSNGPASYTYSIPDAKVIVKDTNLFNELVEGRGTLGRVGKGFVQTANDILGTNFNIGTIQFGKARQQQGQLSGVLYENLVIAK